MSLRVVSSNPGVSIKVTVRPSRKNADVSTSMVQLSSESLTAKLDPLARLINWRRFFGHLPRVSLGEITYGRFSAASRPHDTMG